MHSIEQSFQVSFEYPVVFTRHVFSDENDILPHVFARAGAGPHRFLTVIDEGVLAAHPQLPGAIESMAKRHADTMTRVADPIVVVGGERCKQDADIVETIHEAIAKHDLCRHSFVLMIGGGAVLDAIGFAASTAHRGIRAIRMPTTTLSQNDAGIGVKNAINFLGRKNFVGTFAPPFAVINDFDFLASLEARDRRAGIAEAIKVGLIKDAAFFDRLCEQKLALADLEASAVEEMIIRCAELHLAHIASSGDPFESGSARPLDFGHWAAHKLEEAPGADLRHGEAVAIGIAIDSLYSHRSGRIDEGALLRILMLLEGLGFKLSHPALRNLDIERGLADFRAHLGGELCITLLEAIGRGVEVAQIDLSTMQDCVDSLLT